MSVSLQTRRAVDRRLRRSAALVLALSLVATIIGMFPGGSSKDAAFAAGNQPDTKASRDNTIFAFAFAGEDVVVSGSPASNIGSVVAPEDETFSGPGTYTATQDGVWTVELLDGGAYDWTVDVSSDGDIIPGRAWSYLDRLSQAGGMQQTESADLNYWIVNDTGYIYFVELAGYNGVTSDIQANAYGFPDENCAPTYASYELSDGETWDIPDCGEVYRIFYEEPDTDLPTSAPSATGEITILPDVLETGDLEIDDLAFTPESAGSAAGTFTYSINPRFSGAYRLEIDVDGDGNYNDPVDRTILLTADGSGTYSYAFDGLDGNGEPIEECTAMNARIFFDKLGEVHMVQTDVEGRAGGIAMTRLNGAGAPDPTIYWNDGDLTETRTTTTPVLVGDAVDSTGGVHGWDYHGWGWGDDRHIDDWAYLPVEFATGEVQVAGQCLEVDKSSNATENTRVGDTVTYTVSATNTGDADYTEADPAVVIDDLSGVLDDAEYNTDADANQPGDVSYENPYLSWTGGLPAGETVDLTYSVTLQPGGDREVKNVAFIGDSETPPGEYETPACDLDPTRVACEEFDLPALTIKKEADKTELPRLGETVTYTVTIENLGPGSYTDENPATMTDDLSDVLDDATIPDSDPDSSTGEATIDGNTLSWEGALAAGESATVTYTATYTGEGNQKLDNTACVPEDETSADGTSCATVEVPGSGLAISKESNPSTTSLETGSYIDYTLWFANEGQAAASVDHTDFIGYVIDDATIVEQPAAGEGDLTATLTGDNIRVVGSVPAGESYSINYRVEVKPEAERGDNLLVNHLLEGDPEEPPNPPVPGEECVDTETTTCNPVGLIEYDKTVSSDEPLGTGSVLTYEIRVSNTGEAQASVDREDVLTDVLDDARLKSDPESDTGSVTVSAVENDRFRIGGTLEAGETATVTYDVTLKADEDRGNNRATNFLVTPGEEPPVECEAGDEECTDTPLPLIEPQKTVDPESGTTVIEGDVLTYTLTFANTGDTAGAIDYTDLLAGVLDDADLTDGPTSSSGSVDATITSTEPNNELRVTGEIVAGETVTVTYSVTVKPDGERGDNELGNFLVRTGEEPPAECDVETGLCTENPVPYIVSGKRSDPASDTPVVAGDELTYTLTFTNDGKATGEVAQIDDLTHVLDDADVTVEPEVSGSALTANRNGNIIAIAGELDAGQSESVTYTVTVRDANERGDDVLANYLLDSGTEPPVEPMCEPGEDENLKCTRHSVGEINAAKAVDPATGTHVVGGQELTYTLTFTNTGQGLADVHFVDHLADVLDDAVLMGEPVASESLSVTGPEAEALTITGAVGPSETATVTYTVKVKDYDAQGNHNLGNFLTLSGEEPPAECVGDNPLCTDNPVDPPKDSLPRTGSNASYAILGALVLIGLGGVLIANRKTIEK